jgi:imidazoleglycerol-phosphate dehydratase
MRTANLKRETGETRINVVVKLDGRGEVLAKTGFKFIDHLVCTFGKYSMADIELRSKSHDSISHHLIEDIGITIGKSLDKALGRRSAITRFGNASVPMDESLSSASIDLIRRQYCKLDLKLKRKEIEGISGEDVEHFIRSLIENLNACIHITVEYGNNDHHKIESAIKAFAIAFREAASDDSKRIGIPSTKGAM